mgnify:CR=1 FL=1
MPLLTELNTIADVLIFLVWCCAVWALAQALFRSLPAAELRYRLQVGGRHRPEIEQLRWELSKRRAWDAAAAAGDPLVRPRELNPEELAARRDRLAALSRASWPLRTLLYLLDCSYCQHGWSSLLLVLCLANWGCFWSDVVPAALAYAGAVTLGTARLMPSALPPQQRAGGCGKR